MWASPVSCPGLRCRRTKGKLSARSAAMRVRVADHPPQRIRHMDLLAQLRRSSRRSVRPVRRSVRLSWRPVRRSPRRSIPTVWASASYAVSTAAGAARPSAAANPTRERAFRRESPSETMISLMSELPAEIKEPSLLVHRIESGQHVTPKFICDHGANGREALPRRPSQEAQTLTLRPREQEPGRASDAP